MVPHTAIAASFGGAQVSRLYQTGVRCLCQPRAIAGKAGLVRGDHECNNNTVCRVHVMRCLRWRVLTWGSTIVRSSHAPVPDSLSLWTT